MLTLFNKLVQNTKCTSTIKSSVITKQKEDFARNKPLRGDMVESAAVGNVGAGMGVSHSVWVTAAAGVKAGSRDSSSFVRKTLFNVSNASEI